jgi:hypothetical protein
MAFDRELIGKFLGDPYDFIEEDEGDRKKRIRFSLEERATFDSHDHATFGRFCLDDSREIVLGDHRLDPTYYGANAQDVACV